MGPSRAPSRVLTTFVPADDTRACWQPPQPAAAPSSLQELFCVSDVFIADEELFAEARALGLVDGGEGSVTGSGLTHKPAHLWQPASFVADALPRALASFEGRDEVRVVDFGCGVGRDCVFAALQDERVRVVAVDSSAVAMERLAALGGVHGVAGRVTGLQLDIRKQSPEAALAEAEAALGGPVDIVVGVRFLHRELLQALPARLRPGACVLWSHFALPCGTSLADFKAAHGHPSKQRDVLEAGELARIFEGWTVLVERVDTLLDGRPLACLLTRK